MYALIESDAYVGYCANLRCHAFIGGGVFVLGPVKIKRRARLGPKSVVQPFCVVEDGATLLGLSVVPMGLNLKRGVWVGNPATLETTESHPTDANSEQTGLVSHSTFSDCGTGVYPNPFIICCLGVPLVLYLAFTSLFPFLFVRHLALHWEGLVPVYLALAPLLTTIWMFVLVFI